MEKNPIAIKMLRNLTSFPLNQIPREDREKMECHDPSDPFASISSYTKATMYDGRRWVGMAGNSISYDGNQLWIDEEGQIIDTGKRGAGWSQKQGENLADELKAIGVNARFTPNWHKSSPKELGEIRITLQHDYTDQRFKPSYQRVQVIHGLIIKMMTHGISGEPEVVTFVIRSWGRRDIAENIKKYMLRRAEIMPRSTDEAICKAEAEITKIYNEAFAPIGKHVLDLKCSASKSGGISCVGRIMMLDALLDEREQHINISFNGRDLDNVWKYSKSYHCHYTDERTVKRELERRAVLNKTGLTQTSLAGNIIAMKEFQALPFNSRDGEKNGRYQIRDIHNLDAELKTKNGRIEATADIGDNTSETSPWLRISTGKATLYNVEGIPQTMVNELKGRKLNALIEHELLSDDIVITSAKHNGKKVELGIRMASSKVTIPTSL